MKIRNEFVTNSSSASFVISRKDLTQDQIIMIYNHMEIGYEILPESELQYIGRYDEWMIWEDEEKDTIKGDTMMDNFNMIVFLTSIGIPREKIEYDDNG